MSIKVVRMFRDSQGNLHTSIMEAIQADARQKFFEYLDNLDYCIHGKIEIRDIVANLGHWTEVEKSLHDKLVKELK